MPSEALEAFDQGSEKAKAAAKAPFQIRTHQADEKGIMQKDWTKVIGSLGGGESFDGHWKWFKDLEEKGMANIAEVLEDSDLELKIQGNQVKADEKTENKSPESKPSFFGWFKRKEKPAMAISDLVRQVLEAKADLAQDVKKEQQESNSDEIEVEEEVANAEELKSAMKEDVGKLQGGSKLLRNWNWE